MHEQKIKGFFIEEVPDLVYAILVCKPVNLGDFLLFYRVPQKLGLQRLTLNKKTSKSGQFTYILMCELSEALAHLPDALDFVQVMRDRQCGFTALYSVDHFF